MNESSQGRASDAPAAFRLQVFRVNEGVVVHIRTLSQSYGGLLTHWLRNRSVICDGADCRACKTDSNRVWKGYFGGEVWDASRKWWSPVVVELTEASELDLRHRYERGQIWKFSRTKPTGKKRSPVKAEFVEAVELSTLPPSFDFYPVLRTLYHIDHVSMTVANPVPDRVYVEPTAGVGPSTLERRPAEAVEQPAEAPVSFKERLRRAEAESRANGHARP